MHVVGLPEQVLQGEVHETQLTRVGATPEAAAWATRVVEHIPHIVRLRHMEHPVEQATQALFELRYVPVGQLVHWAGLEELQRAQLDAGVQARHV